MKLVGSFYTIIRSEVDDHAASLAISLNASDVVYQGHFPGYPVTPGVIQLKLTEDILSGLINVPLRLASISQVKFLKVINPVEDNTLTIDLTYEKISSDVFKVNATYKQEETVVFKLNAVFSRI